MNGARIGELRRAGIYYARKGFHAPSPARRSAPTLPREGRFAFQGGRWQALRRRALERDEHVCVACARRGIVRGAEEVDHIEPRARRPDLCWSLENLQSLCRSHHIEKTRAENRGWVIDENGDYLGC